MLEMFYLRWYWVGAFTFVNLVFMVTFLIITRVHYTIDIIAGIIFATTSFRLTILIGKYEDYLLSIPFYIARILFYKFIKPDKNINYESVNHRETDQIMKIDTEQAMWWNTRMTTNYSKILILHILSSDFFKVSNGLTREEKEKIKNKKMRKMLFFLQ